MPNDGKKDTDRDLMQKLAYDGPDRLKKIRAQDCERYAKERLGIPRRTYYQTIHPYVKAWMQEISSYGQIQKGRYLDFLHLLERTNLSPSEAAHIWGKAPYWPPSDEIEDSFLQQVRELGED
jgi:hypothetical protein